MNRIIAKVGEKIGKAVVAVVLGHATEAVAKVTYEKAKEIADRRRIRKIMAIEGMEALVVEGMKNKMLVGAAKKLAAEELAEEDARPVSGGFQPMVYTRKEA